MNMIYTAIAIFGMTAILGLYLLSLILRNKKTPKAAAFVHGLFAVTGLVLLIIYCVGNSPGPKVSITVFTIAAVGGFIVVYKDVTGKAPKWLAILHGLTAVIGYGLLIAFAFLDNY
jgi:hypothetical protein